MKNAYDERDSDDSTWAPLAELFQSLMAGLLLLGAGAQIVTEKAAVEGTRSKDQIEAVQQAERFRAMESADLAQTQAEGSPLPVSGLVLRLRQDGSLLYDGQSTTINGLATSLGNAGKLDGCLLAMDAQARVADALAVELALRRIGMKYTRVFVRVKEKKEMAP